MRRIALVGLVFLLGQPPALGQASCNERRTVDPFGNRQTVAECRGEHRQSRPGAPGRGREPGPPMEQVITAVGGQTCTAWRPVRLRPGQTYEDRMAALDRSLGAEGWALWHDLLGRYPTCASLRARPPEEVAAAFVRTIVPPGPAPRIDPGFAVAGKPAYLRTTGPTTHDRTFDTPLGPLVVRLRAVDLTVDWGDGSGLDQGPFAAPALDRKSVV
jgi:hypothetical protein